MLKLEHVTKIFGPDPASALPLLDAGKTRDEIKEQTDHLVGVQDASFELNKGETFVIMGLSGSGKSTLLRCINRLIEPTAGKIFLDTGEETVELTGLSQKALRDVRTKYISMVFQHFGLLPHRTISANVGYGLEVQGRNKAKRTESAQNALELVGLGQWGASYPDELSGGMQQRVGLARALATEAPVLLMDEPFSALDPLIKVDMQDELIKIEKQLGRTIVFITHDLNEALRLGHRVAIMEAGRVVQIGTPEEIIVNPQTGYVANFVEHADPAGVMTAKSVALPLSDSAFDRLESSAELDFYEYKRAPGIVYGVDSKGKFSGLWRDGEQLELRELASVDTDRNNPFTEPRTTFSLTCSADTTLRELMRGRVHSGLPTAVIGPHGELSGIVTEYELLRGLLDKRSSAPNTEPNDIGSTNAEPARSEPV